MDEETNPLREKNIYRPLRRKDKNDYIPLHNNDNEYENIQYIPTKHKPRGTLKKIHNDKFENDAFHKAACVIGRAIIYIISLYLIFLLFYYVIFDPDRP